MVITSASPLHPKPCHHDTADTLRATPALLVGALQEAPGLRHSAGQPPGDVGNLRGTQTGSHTEGPAKRTPHVHQGEEFVSHVIGCNQWRSVRLSPHIGRGMIGIMRDEGRTPGPWINKDHPSPSSRRSCCRCDNPSTGLCTGSPASACWRRRHASRCCTGVVRLGASRSERALCARENRQENRGQTRLALS
jgi:hypothetical protein